MMVELDGQGIVIPAEQLDIKVHNGYVTMFNPATGKWRTMKIYTFKKKGDYFDGARRVALLSGQDNTKDYTDVGFITRDGRLVIYPSKRGANGKRSAIEKMGLMLTRPAFYQNEKGAEYRISGICRRCNRRLTTPASVDGGIGPECAKKLG